MSSTANLVIGITVMIGFIIVAIALIWLGVLIYKHIYHCTVEVNARLYDIMPHVRNDGKYNYYPVFRYNYKGKFYETEAQQKFAGGEEEAKSYKEDEMMKIRINPDDPQMFLYASPVKDKRQMVLMFVLAAAAGVGAILTLLLWIL